MAIKHAKLRLEGSFNSPLVVRIHNGLKIILKQLYYALSGKEVHARFLQRLESAALPSGHEAL